MVGLLVNNMASFIFGPAAQGASGAPFNFVFFQGTFGRAEGGVNGLVFNPLRLYPW